MGNEWKIVRIEEIADKIGIGPFGSSIKIETFVSNGIPVISGSHLKGIRLSEESFNYITEEHSAKLKNANVFRGDVVFTHAGTIGQVAFIPKNSRFEKYILSQRQFYFRPNLAYTIPEYITYYFKSPDGQHKLLANASYSGVPSIAQPVSYLRRIEIELPPLPTQKAIAHILGTLDDKIELLRSMNETLEAMARALFKSWFIDFDPVRKKAEGQSTGLPPEIDALFPDSFADSELGEIPKGWEAVPLSSRFGFLPGYAFKSQDWAESGIPVIKIGSVKPGFVDLSQVSFVSEEIAITANRFRLKVGDIVIGMTGYVGEVGLIPNTKTPPLLNQRVGKFVLTREGTSELGFIYCLTRRKEFKSMVETNSHGTAQANVSSEGIMSIKKVFPRKSLYDAFNAKTQYLFDTLLSNKYEMDILESIRDSLLPRLISGELELSDSMIKKILEPTK